MSFVSVCFISSNIFEKEIFSLVSLFSILINVSVSYVTLYIHVDKVVTEPVFFYVYNQ